MADDYQGSGPAWFLRGMVGIISLPALVLLSAFVGFSGFALEAGISLQHALFMVFTVWALPAQVILVGSILSGASLPATFLAVSLSSIRLMPMVAALVPEIRTERTRTAALLGVSHFIAVTVWVVVMSKLAEIPRGRRVSYVAGFGSGLCLAAASVLAVCYQLVGELPPLVGGTLFFLTPIYFLTSIWAAARGRSDHFAMLAGLALGPAFHLISPEFDILYAGILGGALGFAADRLVTARAGRKAGAP